MSTKLLDFCLVLFHTLIKQRRIAFVLTRPFGATLGDVMTKSQEKGGLNFGTVGSSIVLLSILLVCIAFTTFTQRKLMATVAANDE
ncbi:hypothetical protein QUB60_28600 [Microcoleus sp. A2-C5]|uniref:hypothetical protein n=1 Tax=unclassified Microcoleus TaxID=2642155 RepID=UPI002FD4ABFC